MTFTYVDAIVAGVVAISAFLAWSRGLTRELLSIGGWIIAALGAVYLAPLAAPLVAEIPWLGPKLAGTCLMLMIASFSLILALFLLLLAIFTPIFASAVTRSVLGPVDRALGFLFGIARGLLLIAVGFLLYENFAGGDELPDEIANAASRGLFIETAAMVEQYRPREVPSWLESRVSALTAPCGDVSGDVGGEVDSELVEPEQPELPADG